MILIDHPCDRCKHLFPDLLDGWNMACNAFPNGIPDKFFKDTNPSELTECNNGIKYEPKDD